MSDKPCFCRRSEVPKVCFNGNVCFHQKDLPDIVRKVQDNESFMRVLKKAEIIDKILQEAGKNVCIKEAFFKVTCPGAGVGKNAQTALQIEPFLDAVLDRLGKIKTN